MSFYAFICLLLMLASLALFIYGLGNAFLLLSAEKLI